MDNKRDFRQGKPGNWQDAQPRFDIEIEKIPDYNHLVKKADIFGKLLKDERVKRSQFRRVFTHIKKIQSNMESKKLEKSSPIPPPILKDILLLKPKMAYTAGRHQNLRMFYEVVVKFVNPMKTVEEFNRFYDFVEATLAYHRFHGGQD
jgi:CRISPR-associated protein Csm2